MKRYYIYLLLCLCIISCNSQENQAYKDAIASNSIAALRGYLISFDGNMSKKHLKNAESILDALVLDSVFYNEFLNAKDTIQKYNICKEYQEQKVGGPHSTELKTFEVNQKEYYYNMEKLRFEEIDNMEPGFKSYNLHLKFVDEFPYGKNVETAKAFIEHNKDAHQQRLSEFKELRKVFANYKFDGYDITGPNEYGEGELSKIEKAIKLYGPENYKDISTKRLDVLDYKKYKGKYYLDEDLLLHADITESDSLVLIAYSITLTKRFNEEDVSRDKQLMSKYKSKLRKPDEHHFVCKLLTYSNGNYSLRMQEKGKEIEYYEGILK